MKVALTVDSAGRVVLPSEARKRLNLRAGSRLLMSLVAERIELTPEPEADDKLVQGAGKRMVLAPSGKRLDAAAATRNERAAQARSRKSR